ncbi:2-polyprenyl-3-methyl-5-hydroxy-6-metoxy-1,4-benzoquinol methylase/predicted O-methyltransferase YrrM [Bacillus sp. SORGH_AS 510]|uniref:class I SAM-dependent methyltransferase n=1 Tax=Bacillus sp. SORGH_AS_0510 TaxID=3041771 RepID=UPI00277F15A5|nr:methyltransferase domain-containing protein [Bacillus sp. SORGH_AS_0510]MDQ1143589.1 2-polyprenyl-3-methyl-5-hydroxy-6-metoxy-1,4-benzoquinol methylase/predicted O-methyltransferase YrrM [Bacillus sp. SORGH_AS_0510]
MFELKIHKDDVVFIDQLTGSSEVILTFGGHHILTPLSTDTLRKKYFDIIHTFPTIQMYTYGEAERVDMVALTTLVFKKLMSGKNQQIRALEMGSGYGCSSYFLASVLKVFSNSNYLFCMDSWEPRKEQPDLAHYQNVFDHFRSMMKYTGVYEQIKSLVCDPQVGMETLQDDFFDVIFVNGNHEKQDIIHAVKKIKVGGLLIGYNYSGLNEMFGEDLSGFGKSSVWNKTITKEDKLRCQQMKGPNNADSTLKVREIASAVKESMAYLSSQVQDRNSPAYQTLLNQTIQAVHFVEKLVAKEDTNRELKLSSNLLKSCLLDYKLSCENNAHDQSASLMVKDIVPIFTKWIQQANQEKAEGEPAVKKNLHGAQKVETGSHTQYDKGFFSSQQHGSLLSAKQVVPYLINLLKPKSVVDVGCGVGTWLSVFKDQGVEVITGLDGDYVDTNMLHIPKESFISQDVSKSFTLDRQYDLVVSLEVAEHLREQEAEPFVDNLVSLGPIILFSAAIPLQGGTDHLNEQWPDYWRNIFLKRGYLAVDCIRGVFWNNSQVEWWYRQNMIMYVKKEWVGKYPELEAFTKINTPLSIVHPAVYYGRNRLRMN